MYPVWEVKGTSKDKRRSGCVIVADTERKDALARAFGAGDWKWIYYKEVRQLEGVRSKYKRVLSVHETERCD